MSKESKLSDPSIKSIMRPIMLAQQKEVKKQARI